jgi:hypothetical protein
MTKENGLAAAFWYCGYDVSNDVVAVRELSGGPALLDGVTGIDKQAYERIGGKRTGAQRITTWFNPAVGMAHDRLGNLPTIDVMGIYAHRRVAGRPAHCMIGKQANYDGTRAEDGSLTFDSDIESNAFGGEWATLLTDGKRTDTAATNGTGVDFTTPAFTGSSTFGAQFYLQAFALTGTSCTVTIEDSADNSSWATLSGMSFTAFTGPAYERIMTARNATVRRYLRAVTTGTFTSATFVVAAVRNDVTTVF